MANEEIDFIYQCESKLSPSINMERSSRSKSALGKLTSRRVESSKIQFINDYHNTHIDILLNPCENAIFLFQYYDQARNFEIRFMGT